MFVAKILSMLAQDSMYHGSGGLLECFHAFFFWGGGNNVTLWVMSGYQDQITTDDPWNEI